MREALRLGTRGSALARAQTAQVAARLRRLHPGLAVEEIPMQTRGDAMRASPVRELGGKGVFVKEIEDALLRGEVDAAVHSLKDLPGELPEGLVLGAIPEREEPWDALVSRGGESIRSMAPGAGIGTGSLRRITQLRRFRPDLRIVEMRGNVDTRLRKMAAGAADGLLLAAAGLNRLGLGERATEILAPELMLPAAGQGALAVEIRDGDAAVRARVLGLDDAGTRRAVLAERVVMARLEGGCQLPLAVFAEETRAGEFRIRGRLASLDGRRMVEAERRGAPGDAVRLAEELAEEVLSRGGAEILRGMR